MGIPCPAGFFCRTPSEKEICPGGNYCPQGVIIQSPCQTCGAHQYLNITCPVGSSSDTSICGCYPGYYHNGTSTALIPRACTECPAGTYGTASGAVSYQCLLCGAGTYSTALAINATDQCMLCRTGTYSTALGLPASQT